MDTSAHNEAMRKFQKEWKEKEERQKETNVCECDCHLPPDEHGRAHGHMRSCCTSCLFCGKKQIMDAARHTSECHKRVEAKAEPPSTDHIERRRNIDNVKQILHVLVLHALLGDSVAVGRVAQYITAMYVPASLQAYLKEILTPNYEV